MIGLVLEVKYTLLQLCSKIYILLFFVCFELPTLPIELEVMYIESPTHTIKLQNIRLFKYINTIVSGSRKQLRWILQFERRNLQARKHTTDPLAGLLW